MDAVPRDVKELIEHGQAEDAALVCRYVIEFWEKMELASWVEDGIAELAVLIPQPVSGSQASVGSEQDE